MVFAAKLENIDGMVAVCGAYHEKNVPPQGSKLFIRDYQLVVDGRVLVENLKYFGWANTREEVTTATRNCRLTTIPWTKSLAAKPLTYHQRGSGEYSYTL